MTAFVATLALVGVVIIVAALLSGLADRIRFPQVALFLALGAAVGPFGLHLVDFQLTSPVLAAIATLGLVLVLFTDAVTVNLAELRAPSQRRLALLVIGPGTLLTAALIAVAGWGLLGLSPALATILGASLASTDPVMVRGLLRGDVPTAARQALRLESGLNDLVLLPIVLVAISLGAGVAGGVGVWARLLTGQLLLGPLAGVVVGFVAVGLLEGMRKRFGIRRDYESLYALGISFAAFAAAEAMHGSGFLAAFAAGLTVAAFDAELCDCFLDYGEATAEMFLLLTFVAFGASLIWTGLDGLGWRTLAFAAVGLGARSLVLWPALARIRGVLDGRSRRLITWFGPRGLSSLLLVLLPVFAGLEGAERLFPPAALVVLLSVVIHGGALMVTARSIQGGRPHPGDAATTRSTLAASSERITLEEVRSLQAKGERVVLLDVRKERAWGESDSLARGAVRLSPDGDVARRAAELALPRHDWLVAYCA